MFKKFHFRRRGVLQYAPTSDMEAFLISASRVIGKPRGWERLVRALLPPVKFEGKEIYLKTMVEGYVFPVDPATMIGWNIHFFHTYEPEVREQIKSILKPGGVAFDVGANVGWHTLLMASRVGTLGRVYAFEPNPTSCERLLGAVSQNGFSQVGVDHGAVTDREGEFGFEAPPAGNLWDGTGHLLATSHGQSVVSCTTIDHVVQNQSIDRLDLIKIDVEGWELSVMRGARQTIEILRPKVIFEFDSAYVSRCGGTWMEIAEFFADLRYELFFLNPRHGMVKLDRLQSGCGNLLAVSC